MITHNPAVTRLPKHLKDFIIDQNYEHYTGRDHAVWCYVMRRNLKYLTNVAHSSYLEGLNRTGISINYIPSVQSMNEILKKIGWGAVCVDGFIPPASFMEFQMHKVLVIAADIRAVNQIEYTPAPDIIHEAAGHAPIIADEEYAQYLIKFGEIGSKAFSSAYDYELYEAIRHLSILKADPNSAVADIKEAEHKIELPEKNPAIPSEMSLIRNLHWWTVEYGLIGDIANPKIYGAGLLSSIGESVWALSDQVKKLEYSIDARDYSFDITKPQPQLFVTPNFKFLHDVLDEFASQMSLKIGGIHGLIKAIESKNPATAVLKSGIQICGVLDKVISSGSHIAYIRFIGPSMLCFGDKMLSGHGPETHAHGYGTPVGRVKGAGKPMRMHSTADLAKLCIIEGKKSEFEFQSGVQIKGVLHNVLHKDGNLILLSFTDCTVTYQDTTLFHPDWGIYDMAIGEEVISVYAGVADAERYGLKISPPAEITHRIDYSAEEKRLFDAYDKVRALKNNPLSIETEAFIKSIIAEYPQEWLLLLEALEFVGINNELGALINEHLTCFPYSADIKRLIHFGMEML